MKIFNKTVILSLLFTMLTTSSCAKKEDGVSPGSDADTTPTTDGSQTATQLSGSGSFCTVNTTVGGTYAYVHSFSMVADGTYTYSVYLTDAATCATAQNSAGNNYATYTQTGTFVVQGTAGTPSTGTKVALTVVDAYLTVRSATYGAVAQNLATWLNAQCMPNPAFSTVSDQTKTFLTHSCNGSGAYAAYVFPAIGDTFTNAVYNTGTTLESGISSGQDLWKPGGSSYPASYTETYLGWL